MSCHYSCSTCSANYYYDLCLTCPSTRTLSSNTCPCSSGYYQYQQTQCTSSSSLSTFDSGLMNVATFAYYAAIGLHFLIIILTINRILSIKVKKIIDAFQVIALINYYRYLQTDVATSGLKIMDAFNFNYLTNLICTKSAPPYGCSGFQNLIGPGFTLIIYFLLFILSYFVGYCIYSFHQADEDSQVIYIKDGRQIRGRKDNSLSCLIYWDSLYSSVFLLYLDQTAIQTTMAISRIAIINYYGVLLAIPFMLIVILIVRAHFITINDGKQTTLAYRAKHSYFYYYDEYYHLNYIDHLFDAKNMNEGGDSLKRPYYPQSNLIIIQILFKILMGASTIVFYQYEPYLFGYCCIFLLTVCSCIMRVFFTYQIFQLWFYYLMIFAVAFANITFMTSKFFTYFIIFTALILLILSTIFIIMSIASWRREKEGQMYKKIFELERQKQKSNRIANLQQSENQLISNNPRVTSNLDLQQINPDVQNQQNQSKIIEPSLNLSRKQTIPHLEILSKRKQTDSNAQLKQTGLMQPRFSRVSRNDSIANKLSLKNRTSQNDLTSLANPIKNEQISKNESRQKKNMNVFLEQEEISSFQDIGESKQK